MAVCRMDCSTTLALDRQAAQSTMGSSNEIEADWVVTGISSAVNTGNGNSGLVQGSEVRPASRGH